MMTLFHFLGVRVVWNRISNSCSFQPWNKNEILRLVLELFWFQKWHVFANLNFGLFRALCARTTRAQTCTDGKFWNALNDLKRALHWLDFDFEQFYILTRVVTRTGTRIVDMLTNLLNLVNLWWTDMKISLIMWKHKMAPGWRHGWVSTLKSFAWRFLIMIKIL